MDSQQEEPDFKLSDLKDSIHIALLQCLRGQEKQEEKEMCRSTCSKQNEGQSKAMVKTMEWSTSVLAVRHRSSAKASEGITQDMMDRRFTDIP